MRNKFPGICYRCNKPVKLGEGFFEKHYGKDKWRVQHATCCKNAKIEPKISEKELLKRRPW